MKKLVVLAIMIIEFIVVGSNRVEASSKYEASQEMKNNARGLYGVSQIYEESMDTSKAEKKFMACFKTSQQLGFKIKGNKKLKKVVSTMDKTIIEARIAFNSGKQNEAITIINTWVREDYQKTLNVLYE